MLVTNQSNTEGYLSGDLNAYDPRVLFRAHMIDGIREAQTRSKSLSYGEIARVVDQVMKDHGDLFA